MKEMNPKNTGLERLVKATHYSLSGLRYVFTSQAAFRQECLVCCILIPVACFLGVSTIERVMMISALLLIMIVEILNTAFEITINRISAEIHPLSKHVKDMGSAAVFITLLNAVLIWVIILF